MDVRRIVFEGGITLRREPQGSQWRQLTSRTPIILGDPRSVISEFGLRPVVFGESVAPIGELTLLRSLRAEEWLDIKGQLFQAGQFLDSTSLLNAINLTYVVGAVIYHCKRLAEIYSELLQTWLRWPRPPGENDPDELTLGSQLEPYFELEALLTAALRAYDCARYLVWRRFGPSAPCPRSFERMLPALRDTPRVPEELLDRLDGSWRQYGSAVKEYRDCFHHYVPLGRGLPYAIVTQVAAGLWRARCPVPDNPEARAHVAFRYRNQLDALTYGWSVATEIVDLMRFVSEQAATAGGPVVVPTHAWEFGEPEVK